MLISKGVPAINLTPVVFLKHIFEIGVNREFDFTNLESDFTNLESENLEVLLGLK